MVFYLVENYIFFTMFITVIYSSQFAGGGGGRGWQGELRSCHAKVVRVLG